MEEIITEWVLEEEVLREEEELDKLTETLD